MSRTGFYNKLKFKDQLLHIYVVDTEFFVSLEDIKNVLSIDKEFVLREPHYRLIKDENVDNEKYLTVYGLYYLHFSHYQLDFENFLLNTLFPKLDILIKQTKALSGDELYFPFVSDAQIKSLQTKSIDVKLKKRKQIHQIIPKKFPELTKEEAQVKEQELIQKNKTFEIQNRQIILHTTKAAEFIKYFTQIEDESQLDL